MRWAPTLLPIELQETQHVLPPAFTDFGSVIQRCPTKSVTPCVSAAAVGLLCMLPSRQGACHAGAGERLPALPGGYAPGRRINRALRACQRQRPGRQPPRRLRHLPPAILDRWWAIRPPHCCTLLAGQGIPACACKHACSNACTCEHENSKSVFRSARWASPVLKGCAAQAGWWRWECWTCCRPASAASTSSGTLPCPGWPWAA